ncbi:MAG: TetR/AcrR family transcriptional regulator [Moheibacter sp.]
MSEQENELTEELIKSTAKRLFFREGKFNATTQEIADAAGVNRTLINYYFRSRNNLFEQVFEEAQIEETKKSESILFSDKPFKDKIAEFIDYSMEVALEYPYLEIYLVTQINQGCAFNKQDQVQKVLPEFFKQIQTEIKKGTIRKMEPIQFVMNVISLISFPLCMRPLIQESMQIDNAAYNKLLKDRKKIILDTLFVN